MRINNLTVLFGRVFVLGGLLAAGSVGFSQQADIVFLTDEAVEEPVAPQVQLSPEAGLLRDTLQAAGSEFQVLFDFYESRGFERLWDEPARNALVLALETSDRHGLPVSRYGGARLAHLFQTAHDSSTQTAAEIASSQAYLTFARDINSGLLEPRSVDGELHVFPKRPNELALLNSFAVSDDPAGFLDGLAPVHPHYTKLLVEKERLENLVLAGGWLDLVPSGGTLRPGDSGPRVAAMRARLDKVIGTNLGVSEIYDDTLVEAVQVFQENSGLNADGVAGPRTLNAMNAGVEDRLAQVFVNLERQRWLNFDRGDRHIYVNIADFMVTVFDDGKASLVSRAVVGLAGKHHTPEFSDEMTHMVVNPTWNVPRSIATEEMLPQLRRNPGALSGRGMAIMTNSGTRINPALVDFTQYTKTNFPFLIKQSPGASNALGRVKFMFPNRFDIYLHDTPSKSLFSKDARAFSHGCVRVQKPFELAYLLLGPQSDNPQAMFSNILNTHRERVVRLDKPVPVYLTYQTAWIDENGVAQYRDDIYGRDRKVFDALVAAGVKIGAVEG